MHATQAWREDGFTARLSAPGRSVEIPESADVYGWLVGSWELEVVHYKAVDVSAGRIVGEAHFGWVLEGRALQEDWIRPRCSGRRAVVDKADQHYSTRWRASVPA